MAVKEKAQEDYKGTHPDCRETGHAYQLLIHGVGKDQFFMPGGSLVPGRVLQITQNVLLVMIEVNKKLYLGGQLVSAGSNDSLLLKLT